MRWATKRKLLYAFGVALVLLVLAGVAWFAFFYHSPTCSDGVMNQNEEGVDCGGLCDKLCQAPKVSALWARAVNVAPGVYHAVALVRNPEANAGTESLPYTFYLYDANNILVAQREGTMFLNPGEDVPLFEANILTGSRIPVRAFADFGQATWKRMERPQNPLAIVSQTLDEKTLKLIGTVENTSPLAVKAALVTALLYDADGVLVTASQTSLATLAAHDRRAVTFTWQVPFVKPIVRADIVARVQH